MHDNFYRAFEEKFRGTRELIKSRLKTYLPFVKIIKLFDLEPKAIDLGCGRGEWLELLGENGYKVQGVDLDAGMLEACRNRGFDVDQKDAILALKELKDESINIVSGFHIVEHLPFEVLQVLVQEAFRVLKSGGLLIMETPNPENIKVATESFYLDPTHIRPIPSKLLSFLTEYYGFRRTKILRLQESLELYNTESINFLQIINGVSPDYAVVAQKEADRQMLLEFDELFNKKYGLSLETLANKFENYLNNFQTQVKHVKSTNNLLYSSETLLCSNLKGFHTKEAWGMWSSGKNAILRIELKDALLSPVHLCIKFGMKIFGPLAEKSPVVEITFGKDQTEYVLFRENMHYVETVELNFLYDGAGAEIVFESTHEDSPVNHGSTDGRNLSFGIDHFSADIIEMHKATLISDETLFLGIQ